jgi:hypothetical protein
MQNSLTGLMVSCQKGMVDIAKALLEAKANTNTTEVVSVGSMYQYYVPV